MAGRNSRARARDMVMSMAVLLVPLALIVWFFTTDPAAEVEAVDVGPVLERAQEESPYPVLHATNLPPEWVPVRVAWAADGDAWITNEPAVGNSWQLGYMAPGSVYVAVQQRDRAVEAFVTEVSRDGRRDGSSMVQGVSWERWASDDGRTRSLVWRDGDVVAVVTGDTDYEQLDAFAGSLSSD